MSGRQTRIQSEFSRGLSDGQRSGATAWHHEALPHYRALLEECAPRSSDGQALREILAYLHGRRLGATAEGRCVWCEGSGWTVTGIMCRTCGGAGRRAEGGEQ